MSNREKVSGQPVEGDMKSVSREARLQSRDERRRRRDERHRERDERLRQRDQQRLAKGAGRGDRPAGGRERKSPRRINQIAELVGAKSYLEIGVARGRTFTAVRIPNKIAVDPKFRFDISEHQAEGVHYHQTTSDDFFAKHPKAEKFDVIFIDGLHVFEQALRDFRNSIEVSHDRTVWIIDDVFPNDEFSAMPDRVRARPLRFEKTGVRTSAWHGDVYKVVFAIHDLHPEFSYVTAATGGNRQSIVWRSRRENVVPVFGSLEAIDKVGYEEFLRRQELLNLRPEDEALQILRDSLKSQMA